MYFDYNEAIFPAEEYSTVVIKILLVFQLKYSRELFFQSVSYQREAKQNPQKI